jgi:2-amino-4-hydroxy-6-hydroxymethyldihydropteridine diphosphokinase
MNALTFKTTLGQGGSFFQALKRHPVKCYVALGANLGDPIKSFEQALQGLHQTPGVRVTACSRLYQSEPFQAMGPPYINSVCAIDSILNAFELLATTQRLELEAGRVREFHHQPRTLDLDLLFFGDAQIQSPQLTIPHPRWSERAFVLLPLMEFEPSWVTPEMLQGVHSQDISLLRHQPVLWPVLGSNAKDVI